MARNKFSKNRPDIKVALELGWVFAGKTGSGHLCFVHERAGGRIILASTSSEYRGERNAISRIRRMTPREED